jgi:hypothetical protein
LLCVRSGPAGRCRGRGERSMGRNVSGASISADCKPFQHLHLFIDYYGKNTKSL